MGGEWNMVPIDHSRALAADRMPFEKQMTRVDRAFFDSLKALDEASVMKQVRPWLACSFLAKRIEVAKLYRFDSDRDRLFRRMAQPRTGPDGPTRGIPQTDESGGVHHGREEEV